MIERADGVRSFHAIYDVVEGPPADAFEDYELELAYQAPDRAFLRFSSSEELSESWCTGERILVHTRSGDGEHWRRAEVSSALRSSAGSGVVVCLTWPGLEDEAFAAWLDFRAPRATPFDWLRHLREASGSARRDGERIYWKGNGFRCWLAAASGLPERLDFRTRDGFEFKLELNELTLDEPLATRLLEPPRESAGAEPVED